MTSQATTSTATQTPSTAEIRRAFMDFFTQRHGHTFVPSAPVVPHEDPTLLFTNAGMNQFKDVFLGQGSREYNRAVNSQKCIRAGGKHNDLEDVGKDNYHHTFFEMLGNWSFGDYFKAEAIEWAWQLLTEVWGLDEERLYVTVFEGDKSDGLGPDTEAEEIWKKFVPAERISRWDKKDNFWEMGDTGPCGPCSEIHYDTTPDKTGGPHLNLGRPEMIEIWNLVFIQFNRDESGRLTPLPEKHVDTGMGLERIARVLQGKTSNYDIDIFQPIFKAIESHTGAHPYGGSFEDPIDIAYRVIADHIRCLSVAITDGARPSNEGRGYVLRRILRRAVRHAHQTLQTKGAWLFELVPSVVETLGEAFPELRAKAGHVADVIKDEEEGFLRTLDRGIELFEDAAANASNQFVVRGASQGWEPAPKRWAQPQLQASGQLNPPRGNIVFHPIDWRGYPGPERPVVSAEDAFKLHDTYGFPIDLTRVMAEERGMTVDEQGYRRMMEEARQRSRAGGDEQKHKFTLTPDAIAELKHLGVRPTDDSDKFHGRPIGADVKAIWNGRDFDNAATSGRRVAIILDRTNFYGEAGGQVGDTGEITTEWDPGMVEARGYRASGRTGGATFRVEDTQVVGGYVLHIGRATDDTIRVGDNATLTIDSDRRQSIRAHHTTTHLLNFALRRTVGEEADQKGSLVAPDRLRFDFSCSHAMSNEQIEQTERIVGEKINEALDVHADFVPLDKGKQINGLRAVFGEKYPDPVRVVSIGCEPSDALADPDNEKWKDSSIEFCGGTHLYNTKDAVDFVILHESALAAGVRRISAIAGEAAQFCRNAGKQMLERVKKTEQLDGEQLVSEFDDLTKSIDDLMLPAVDKHRAEQRLEALRDKVKQVRKQARAGEREQAVEQARGIASLINNDPFTVHQIDGADKDALLSALDVIRAKHPETAAMLLSADEEAGKVMIVAGVPKHLIDKGLKAGDWVKQAAQACGGGGGGRPDSAQAGGKQPEKMPDAIEAAKQFAASMIQ